MKRILFLFIPFFLIATPAQVIFIRPVENSLKGRERASALVPFFQGTPAVLSYGLPAAVFAAAPSDEEPTLRSVQTVLPLCNEISLSVEDRYAANQTQQLVDELVKNPDYEGKMVLVCWPVSEIPDIAKRLGAKKTPKKWADDAYDRLWILDFTEKSEVSYKNIPQKLLFGDSSS